MHRCGISRLPIARRLSWAAAAALSVPLTARAIPDEFRVLTDEVTERGETGLEFQGAAGGARSSSATRPSRRLQGLVEISYGLTETFEVALQLPGSRENGHWRGNGINLEAQYIAPHDSDDGFYWGARAELSRGRSFGEENSIRSLEIRPIIGYRFRAWHAALNAALRKPLSGQERHTSWEPSAKLAYHLTGHTFLGVEYYVQAGQREVPGTEGLRRQLGLLVADTRVGAVNLNLGVGRELSGSGNGTVLKLVIGFDVK